MLTLLPGTGSIDLMPPSELRPYLLDGRCWPLHPGVPNHICHTEPHVCVRLYHARDEVFELGGEEAFLPILRVDLPEIVNLVSHEQAEVIVL